VSAPPATPGGEHRGMGRRPEYVVEIYISPQMRELDPGRPLSLLEALEAGRPQRREGAARTPETESPDDASATRTGSQLRGKVQHAGAGRAEDLPAARGQEHPTGDGEPAQAVRSVECACTASPGIVCSPAGDHLARYLRAEQRGAIARQALRQVIEGLDVITPEVLIPPQGEAAPAAEERAAGRVIRAQPGAEISPDPTWRSGGADPAATAREAPEQEAGA
jgi:hypothetical protein